MDQTRLHPGLGNLVVRRYIGSRDQTNCFDGHGHAQFTNGHTYTGDFKDGMMEGSGVYKWSNGTIYSGRFQRNQITGSGTYTWSDGTIYAGGVLRGMRHGHGILKGPNGSPYYKGSWLLGRRHGFGVLAYNAEFTCRYVGDWVDDNREGRGTMHYASGNVYAGEWSRGNKCGYGKMSWRQPGEYYEGSWSDDHPDGHGEHVWLESRADCGSHIEIHRGNRFCGQWKAGLRHGTGTFYYASGARYSGEWVGGFKQGSGTFIQENGKLFVGNFLKDHTISGGCNNSDCHQQIIYLQIDDILGSSPAMLVERRRLHNSILCVNSELSKIFQRYTANDASNGICAITLQQLHGFCVCHGISPGQLPLSTINNIIKSMRWQHGLMIHKAECLNDIDASAFADETDTGATPSRRLMRDLAPMLYREFVEVLVRFSLVIGASCYPRLTPACAFQEFIVKYVHNAPQDFGCPHLSLHAKSVATTLSFRKALSVLTRNSGDPKTCIGVMFARLCELAPSSPSPSFDIYGLLLASNAEFTWSEVKSLSDERINKYVHEIRSPPLEQHKIIPARCPMTQARGRLVSKCRYVPRLLAF